MKKISVLFVALTLCVFGRAFAGENSLYRAAHDADLNTVKLLVAKGADVNQAENGSMPLHTSAQHGWVSIAKFLLDNGAKPNVLDQDGNAPIHLAARNGHLEMVELLVSNKADINLKNKQKESALHLAIEGWSLNVAKFLIKENADINVLDAKKLFKLAAFYGDIDTIKVLFSKINNRKSNKKELQKRQIQQLIQNMEHIRTSKRMQDFRYYKLTKKTKTERMLGNQESKYKFIYSNKKKLSAQQYGEFL